MTDEELQQVRQTAEDVCRIVRVPLKVTIRDVYEREGGASVVLQAAKLEDMSDAQWHLNIKEVRDRIEEIPNVKFVELSFTQLH